MGKVPGAVVNEPWLDCAHVAVVRLAVRGILFMGP